jgi:orotidine-5'-phosphate decarboxylase
MSLQIGKAFISALRSNTELLQVLGGKGKDLVHFFNEDGLGAIINSSRGIIAAYQNEKYASYGEEGYADASRAAVLDMKKDIEEALGCAMC